MEKIYEYINIGEEGLWRQEYKANCGLLLILTFVDLNKF